MDATFPTKEVCTKPGTVHTVEITPNDDGIYWWDTHIERAVQYACHTAGRDLTPDEWHDAFGNRPYRNTCPQPSPPR